MEAVLNFKVADVPELRDPKYSKLVELAKRLARFDEEQKRRYGTRYASHQMTGEEIADYNAVQKPFWAEWNRVTQGIAPAVKTRLYGRFFPVA